MEDEESYRKIKEARKDIDALNIDEKEKQRLYQMADENVQYIGKSRTHFEVNSQLIVALDKMGKGLSGAITVTIPITNQLPNLEKTSEDSRKRVSLLNETKEIVDKMLPNAKYTGERLRIKKWLRDLGFCC